MMNAKSLTLISVLLISGGLVACSAPTPSPTPAAPGGLGGGGAQLANPASVYCTGLNYTLTIEDTPQGQQGICAFPDGTKCEEWAFFRGECGQPFSYCQKNGGKLEQRNGIATCVFPDGSACAESDFFGGTCKPGNSPGY